MPKNILNQRIAKIDRKLVYEIVFIILLFMMVAYNWNITKAYNRCVDMTYECQKACMEERFSRVTYPLADEYKKILNPDFPEVKTYIKEGNITLEVQDG